MSVLYHTLRRPSGASQKVAYTGTAGSTTALPAGTKSVTCYLSTAGYIKVGYGASSITATAADIPVPANTLVTIDVPDRDPNKGATETNIFVSAVQDAAGGNLFAQPNAE